MPQVGAADSLGEAGGGDAAGEEDASEVGGAVDGSAATDDDSGFGEVTATPEDEVGRADADVLGRAVPFPVPDAWEEASADGVVPPLTAGPVTEAPSPEDRGERAGRGESSTLSAFCPGTGSQGASEPPDSRAATMTTA
ncbi:hypothetical protein [Streptomyces arenae]|uniref:hypothetical protein n=1 Tax=Streptomyces arenae TaxID=29301 RepID=UPI002657DA24|nr:hypothetical protein [Streptomyces arenae]MCG7207143.1 hypothetical protein [Streptomyces arenae]